MTAVADRRSRKQQQRSLKTKQKLLEAALEAFSESGFEGTSTREIASRAGVHHPLITFHFDSKERLWRSAVKHVFNDFIQALQNAASMHASDSPKARFAAMIRIYVRHAALYPALHKMILQESSFQSERLEWLCANYLNPLAEAAAKPIAELQEDGVTPPGDPILIYNMIRVSSGTLIALSLELKNSSGIDIEAEEKLEELSDLIVRVFLPGSPSQRLSR